MPQKKHPWYRSRGYPHFDHPISLHDASKIVKNPSQVSKHSFYPFIEFTVKTFKVKREEGTKKLKRVMKERPIAYASHVDCHIYSYYSMLLTSIYEHRIKASGLQSNVLAFRPLGKSNVDFALEAFETIRSKGQCFVLALDISGFFNNLDHGILKKAWSNVIGSSSLPNDHYAVFKSITNYSTVNLEQLYGLLNISLNNRKTTPSRLCSADEFRSKVRAGRLIERHDLNKGIPQGSPISALLSNIYMFDYDIAMKSFADSCGGHYFRYCDDILLVVPPSEKVAVENLAITEIKKLALEINDKKTDRVDFAVINETLIGSKPLQYLGFLFDGQRILLRSASLARYTERMLRGVRIAKATMKKRNAARVARGEDAQPLFRKRLNSKYTHLGRRNFVTYGYESSRKMNSNPIRKQLRTLWGRLEAEINSV